MCKYGYMTYTTTWAHKFVNKHRLKFLLILEFVVHTNVEY